MSEPTYEERLAELQKVPDRDMLEGLHRICCSMIDRALGDARMEDTYIKAKGCIPRCRIVSQCARDWLASDETEIRDGHIPFLAACDVTGISSAHVRDAASKGVGSCYSYRIIALAKEGKSSKEISKATKLSVKHVIRTLNRAGLAVHNGGVVSCKEKHGFSGELVKMIDDAYKRVVPARIRKSYYWDPKTFDRMEEEDA